MTSVVIGVIDILYGGQFTLSTQLIKPNYPSTYSHDSVFFHDCFKLNNSAGDFHWLSLSVKFFISLVSKDRDLPVYARQLYVVSFSFLRTTLTNR